MRRALRWLVPLVVLVGAVVVLAAIRRPSDASFCARGDKAQRARLLDEAAANYAPAAGAGCARAGLAETRNLQALRNGEIEAARAEREAAARQAARGHETASAAHLAKAQRRYLAALQFDAYAPGARRALRAVLRAQERLLGPAFDDAACARAWRLLDVGLLYEARALSGIVDGGEEPGADCRAPWRMLLAKRGETAREATLGAAYARAGQPKVAFDHYVAALDNDPASDRARAGLARLELPARHTYAHTALGAGGTVAAAIPALAAIVLLLAVLSALGVRVGTTAVQVGAGHAPRRRRAAGRPPLAVAAPDGPGASAFTEALGIPGGALLGPPRDARIVADDPTLDFVPTEREGSAVEVVVDRAGTVLGLHGISGSLRRIAGRDKPPGAVAELEVERVGGDVRMAFRLPRAYGGGLVTATAVELGAARPADPQERERAVATLLGERVQAAIAKQAGR